MWSLDIMNTADKDAVQAEKRQDSARRSVDLSRIVHHEQLPAYALKVVNTNTSFALK